MIPSSGMLQGRLACLYACYVPKLPCGDTDTPISMPALSRQCCNSTRRACLHACCEAQAHLLWCMLCWAYLFTYLPCFIAATWWRGHVFFVCLLYPGVPGRCMDGHPCFYGCRVSALPPGGTGMPVCMPSVSQHHPLGIWRFLFVLRPRPSMGMPVCKQVMSSPAMWQLQCSTVPS